MKWGFNYNYLINFVKQSENLNAAAYILARQAWLLVCSIFSVFATPVIKKTYRRRRFYELVDTTQGNPNLDNFTCLKHTDLNISFPLDNCYLLVTDIIDSTLLYNENPHWMKAQIDEHDRIARRLVRIFHGHIVGNEGDSFHLAFRNIFDAVNFGYNFKDQLDEMGVELSVRIGINRGIMHIRNCCGYKLYGEPVTELIKFFAHSKGDKICIKKSLLLSNNIECVKKFCLH